MRRICVFCGSSSGMRPVYPAVATAFGTLLAQRGLGLVYGGGRVGLMGVVADAVLGAGGEVIGVIPEFLFKKELEHRGATDLRIVGSMHERKAMMADLVDGFVALPGGYGTLDEFCEILTWAQLGLHRKPCGLLNVDGYYAAFLQFLDHASAEGFVQPLYRGLILDDHQGASLLDRMRDYEPPVLARWLTPGQE